MSKTAHQFLLASVGESGAEQIIAVRSALEQRNVSITTVSEQDPDESPLDVNCVETSITRDQIVRAVREGHERV